MDKTTQKIDAQSTATSSAVPNIQIPGYKILRELGHGGMAHVYLAIQESFGREVALKILSPHLADDEQFSKRFLREARIVSQLNHPNIVTVFDAGKHQQYHYMSMEYIPGNDLKQLKDSISREEAISIVKDVAKALDFAGKKGIVHRDVKPENIMIHQSDKRVVLMDFGIAHGDDVTQGMTQTGRAIGTPHFMSPEQTKGLKVDHRSDIYSLGIVLFQLLAGNLPYDADSAVAVGIKHLTAPIPLLPVGLEIFQPIINHCLSKQPQHRYQKAEELIAALDKITNEQLENINTQAKIFKNAGADHNAATQVSDVVISNKRKIPDIVFPSGNRKSPDENLNPAQPKRTVRRNLLFILLIATMAWAGNEKQKELTQFWAYTALPEIVKKFPNLFPKSYSEYWAKRLEESKPKKAITEAIIEANPVAPEVITQNNNSQTNTVDEGKSSQVTQSNSPIEKNIVSENTQPQEKDQITLLKEGLKDNPEKAIELTAIYKYMLSQDKGNVIARNGLKELRESYIQKIQLAFSTEDVVLARQYIDIMKKSFPVATKNKRFIRLEKKVAFLERIKTHLTRAEKYFNAGELSKPINQNALYEIRAVLKLSPNNEDALNFKKKIADSYISKTTQLQQQGNIHNALLMVEEGIAALNNDTTLLNKRKQIQDSIKHNNKIASLFRYATKYQTDGQLIRPQSYNAYDLYQEILSEDENDLKAQAGLKSIHQQLAKKIINLINQGDLKESEDYLNDAIKRYGKSSLLANVQLKLNDAMEAVAPKITAIKLSASPIKRIDLTNSQSSNELPLSDMLTLKVKKSLYVGFNFINFSPETTWLDVTLVDTQKNRTVMQKPIVVSKQFGEYFFDMKLPSGSFTNSFYNVEIKLKNKILISAPFLILN